MKSIAQKIADAVKRPGGLGEHAVCNLCAEEFEDGLAWAAHRPWKSTYVKDVGYTARYGCKWPKALRKSGGIWSLRPSCREAVRLAEDGPPEAFRIVWPTTSAKNSRKPGIRVVPKNDSSVYAGSGTPPSVFLRGRA